MSTRTRSSGIAAVTAAVAITTTFAIQAATATAEPPSDRPSDRPCFITQPRWNTAIDGPPPTCPVPTWQRQPGPDANTERAGSGTSNRMDFGDEYAAPRR